MGIEVVTYISDLVATNPLSSDLVATIDDHVRNFKTGVKNSFPNVSGAVTATHTQLSFVTGVTSAIQTQLDAKVGINGFGSFGYVTGNGGTVAQATSKTTSVALAKVCGEITMNNAVMNAGDSVSFNMTNATIQAGDLLILNHASGGTVGAYTLNAACINALATITVKNVSASTLSEAIVIRFAVIKGVTA